MEGTSLVRRSRGAWMYPLKVSCFRETHLSFEDQQEQEVIALSRSPIKMSRQLKKTSVSRDGFRNLQPHEARTPLALLTGKTFQLAPC